MSSAAGPTPPQPPHDFSYNPSRVSDAIKNGIERTRKLEDQIAALKPEDCTFDSVVKPLALDEAVLDTETDPAGFMQSVSTDKLVRDAATEASMKLSDFGIEVCYKLSPSREILSLTPRPIRRTILVFYAQRYIRSTSRCATEYGPKFA